jgi:membrane protease subunit HflK
MAWNEPGGNNNDPWGNGSKGNQGPPDLDDVFKQWSKKLNGMMGNGKEGNNGSGGTGGLGGSGLPWPAIVIALVVFLGYLSWTPIDEQERGVVLQLGKYNRTLEPGINFVLPLAEQVTKVNVTNIRTAEIREEMLTKDENIVSIEMNIQYRVINPKDFALAIEDPERSVDHSGESALRHEVGSAKLDSILTDGRALLAEATSQRLQSYLERYSTGIQVTNVNVKEARAPSQVQDAFDDVQKAKLDKERYINEAEAYANQVVPEARGKAQRIIEEANGYKEKVIAQAEGETARFTNLLAEYKKAPEVTRERLYLETLSRVLARTNKVVVDVEGGNNMMYLPLDQLKRGAQTELPATTGASSNMNRSDISRIADEVYNELRRRTERSTTREGR